MKNCKKQEEALAEAKQAAKENKDKTQKKELKKVADAGACLNVKHSFHALFTLFSCCFYMCLCVLCDLFAVFVLKMMNFTAASDLKLMMKVAKEKENAVRESLKHVRAVQVRSCCLRLATSATVLLASATCCSLGALAFSNSLPTC